MKTKIGMFLGILVFFCLMNSVNGEVRIDSYVIEPYFIEPGDELDIYLKYHQHPRERLAIHTPLRSESGTRYVLEENLQDYYISRLVHDGDISEKYVLIKDGEKTAGHIFVGETWSSHFKVKIRDDAPATGYKMMFQIYKGDLEGTYEELLRSYSFEIPVTGIAEFDIEAGNSMKIGTTGDVKLRLCNKAGGIAKHVSIGLDLSAPFTPISSSSKYLGSFKAGECMDVSFRVAVSGDAQVKTYEIPVMVVYADRNGSKNTLTTSIGVQIDSEPELSFGLDEVGELAPGVEGNVILSISNEGFVDAKFLKFTLEPTDDYKVVSINEIYIGNLDSDDIETEEFTIKINDGVNKEIIPLKVKLRYKGEGRDAEYVKEDTVNIKILSKQEHAAKAQVDGTSSMMTGALIAIPAIFIGLLVLWFIYKLFGLITGYINRKLFAR